MSNKFGLALVQFDLDPKKYLFEIPLYASLEVGNRVYVEDSNDVATVLSVWDSVFLDSGDREPFDMIVEACGAVLPLKKVVSKIKLLEFNYEED